MGLQYFTLGLSWMMLHGLHGQFEFIINYVLCFTFAMSYLVLLFFEEVLTTLSVSLHPAVKQNHANMPQICAVISLIAAQRYRIGAWIMMIKAYGCGHDGYN